MVFGGNIRKRRSPIGVALTASEVYLAQRTPDDSYLFATHPLAQGTKLTEPTYHTEVSRAIAGAVRRHKFVGKNVVSALPAESLQYKTLRLPPMPDEDLAQAVAWEAAERFQIGEDQALQYYNAGEVTQGSETRQEIILLAADRAMVYDHASSVKRAGLVPIAIDATGAALSRFLGVEGQASLIVHFDQKQAEVVGARGQHVVFDKPIDLPRNGEQVDGTALARELSLCVRYLSVTFGIHKPDHTWISGKGATPTLASELTESLGNPVKHVGQSPMLHGVEFTASDCSAWLIAMGLACRTDAAPQRGVAA